MILFYGGTSGTTQMGDRLLTMGWDSARLVQETVPLLWAQHPKVKAGSPNMVYKFTAKLLFYRNTAAEVAKAAMDLSDLATASLGAIKVRGSSDTAGAAILSVADARLDHVGQPEPADASRGHYSGAVVVEFTSASKPT